MAYRDGARKGVKQAKSNVPGATIRRRCRSIGLIGSESGWSGLEVGKEVGKEKYWNGIRGRCSVNETHDMGSGTAGEGSSMLAEGTHRTQADMDQVWYI
nr:hypothetical protein [Tanacetum cinerariifolium]